MLLILGLIVSREQTRSKPCVLSGHKHAKYMVTTAKGVEIESRIRECDVG